ncbi:HAD family hydrolase [Streptomyces alkaliterrae]|nr:HAD family phosphatase [Streptomyces alkaliterrae]
MTVSTPPEPAGRPGAGFRVPPAALLCDMDGTLVDTEHTWLRCVAGLLYEYGAPALADDITAAFAGLPLSRAAELMAERTGRPAGVLARRLDRVFTTSIRTGLTIRPGALRLLDQAAALGVPIALVTASERAVADLVISELGADRFLLTLADGEASRSKPHPDPYLAACLGLGVAPEDSLAVEDTPAGVTAALTAGCRVLAVPSVPGVERGPRTVVVTSLTEVDLTDPDLLAADPD